MLAVLTTTASLLLIDNGQPTLAAEKLAWKFSPGDTLKLVFEQQSEAGATVRGKPATMKTSLLAEFSWTVKAAGADDAAATIMQELKRLKVTVISGDSAPVEYDSASEVAPRGIARGLAASLEPLLGASWELNINPQGEIIAAKLQSEQQLDPKKLPAAVASLFDEAGLEKLLGPGLGILPATEAVAGDIWKRERELQTPLGELKQTTTYRLDQLQDGVAFVESTADVKVKTAKATKLTEQTQTGKFQFDVTKGRLISSEETQTLVTEKPFQDTTIKVTAKTNSKLTVTDGT